MAASSLTPMAGPTLGGTQVVVVGQGFRDFGALMRCRFGATETTASLTSEPGEWVNPYNHTKMGCAAPAANSTEEQAVAFEVSLNGNTFTRSGLQFSFYRNPMVIGTSPARVSANTPQMLTVTRSAELASGVWARDGLPTNLHTCRFSAVIQPTGKRQVPFLETSAASVVDATELRCLSPRADFVGPVSLSVAVNGQQYGAGVSLLYEDNWHAPAQSGVPPSGREGVAAALVGSDLFLFGGRDLGSANAGFLSDFYVLHTDAMGDFYPSPTALDLAWQKLSLITGGEQPPYRAYASLSSWGGVLLLFGGLAHYSGDSFNTTHEFSTARQHWQQVRPCYRHKNDLHALDLNNMTWTPVGVNTEQPLPDARKAHTATLFNGSQMLIFGGSAWTSSPSEADNSYGFTTKQVADVWRIDLSGGDNFTWHPVHTVGDAPTPREGHVATLVGGRYVVVHGGYAHGKGSFGYLSDTHVLDTRTEPMVWSRPTLTGRVPSARHNHIAIAIEDEIFTFGGASVDGYRNDLHILQLSAGNAYYEDVAQPTYE